LEATVPGTEIPGYGVLPDSGARHRDPVKTNSKMERGHRARIELEVEGLASLAMIRD
jgi:hypothetical protein